MAEYSRLLEDTGCKMSFDKYEEAGVPGESYGCATLNFESFACLFQEPFVTKETQFSDTCICLAGVYDLFQNLYKLKFVIINYKQRKSQKHNMFDMEYGV